MLTDGRSPAPKAVGDLLIALNKAGATAVALPRCAKCGKPMQYLQRLDQDWFCVLCHGQREACTSCGNVRRVFARDRCGQPYCTSCPDPDGRDPVAVIHTVVTALDANADPEVVAEAVRQATARPSSRRKLAWALEDNPRLLTGHGHLTPLRTVLPLIEHLAQAGIAGIVRPTCPRCHRAVRIDKAIDGQRLCRSCFAKAHTAECSRCGALREPATRDAQGRPLCPNCLINDPANLETCTDCGERRKVHTRTSDGPLCRKCRPLPILTCLICDRTTGCTLSRLTGSPRCRACMQRRSRCTRCHRVRQIHSGTLEQPLCGPCTNPTDDLWQPCPGCGSTERLNASRRCLRCVLHRRLEELIPASNSTIPAQLRVLREALASAERPKSALQWLAVNTVSTALKDISAGRRELTHQALDEMPAGKALDHFRSVLVATGALPARDEHLARLEQLVTELIAAHPDHEVRQILHRYAIWHLLRRLRRRTKDTETTHQQLITVRSHLRAAAGFLDWLAAQQLTLATCRQADLERWLTSDHASLRDTTGHFIRWAVKHKAAQRLSFPAVRWAGPSRPLDGESRWSIARRLLHDDALAPEDRLAGLFLLLYAQTPATISRLTIDRIRQADGAVTIGFGSVPIALPDPLANLATQQVALRRGHPVLVPTPSVWLFPGRQPGRPISTSAMGDRLRKLGIGPAETRSTALFQLAADLPAAVLARTLGIHISVAVQWQRAAAGDWASYAAEVGRRQST
ncbi:site-specific integrase [Streptomyces sp. NL15-2K]|uniref:site-specific integrase n=1 Tax=Streptomyces sp. NL15-2K TaxID=376149 RepID=UPI000FFA8012|nr:MULTISPECIES: site-specific integrase [Actinomycetes]WKX07433.1 hypothetical protein Q4V64_07995 [Kutzneria buriramensis]GCB51334.1 hypothetical protein SNL152K_8690 [Streptomyces sp. NL15-2K]